MGCCKQPLSAALLAAESGCLQLVHLCEEIGSEEEGRGKEIYLVPLVGAQHFHVGLKGGVSVSRARPI